MIKTDGITVYSNPEALDGLANLAARADSRYCYVEVGVFQGGSLARIAAATSAHCYGVDTFGLEGTYTSRTEPGHQYTPDTMGIAQQHLRDAGVADRCTLLRGFSADVALTWPWGDIGFWYLDAEHSYDAVLADFSAWEPHLAPGCLIAYDDYWSKYLGVVEAVDELVSEGAIEPVKVIGGRLAVTRAQ